MTSPASISAKVEYRDEPAASLRVRSAVDAPERVRWMLVAIAPLAILYLLLFNLMWVPGGDSDFYLVVARNLLTGNGYTFNGEPVGMSPPGWPAVLAGLMWISPTFGFIKLAMIGFMLTSLALAYCVLLRFCTPRVSAMIILLAGTLHPLYPLTYWTHSESLFCLIAWATVLLAFRINEGRAGWGAIAGVVLLSVAAVLVRWTGLIQVVLVAGILLSNGRWRDRSYARGWIALILVTAMSFATFQLTQHAFAVSRDQMKAIVAAGGGGEREMPGEVEPDETEEPTIVEQQNAEATVLTLGATTAPAESSKVEEYFDRFIRSAKWYAWLFWYPFRFGTSVRAIDMLAMVFGWLTIFVLTITLIVQWRRGNLLWPALALYTGALVMNWPNPNARYFVPVAPLLLAGVWMGLTWLRQLEGPIFYRRQPDTERLEKLSLARVWATGTRLWMISFVASVALCNGALLAVDIYVMRSADFYGTYEAGAHKSLINSCLYAMDRDPPPNDRHIGVSLRYTNLGRTRSINPGLRAAALLTNRIVRPIPSAMARGPSNRLARWARNGRLVPYFLYQEPNNPWRLWHFVMPESLQTRLTGEPVGERTGGWRLYYLSSTLRWSELPVPMTNQPRITRVPGL